MTVAWLYFDENFRVLPRLVLCRRSLHRHTATHVSSDCALCPGSTPTHHDRHRHVWARLWNSGSSIALRYCDGIHKLAKHLLDVIWLAACNCPYRLLAAARFSCVATRRVLSQYPGKDGKAAFPATRANAVGAHFLFAHGNVYFVLDYLDVSTRGAALPSIDSCYWSFRPGGHVAGSL